MEEDLEEMKAEAIVRAAGGDKEEERGVRSRWDERSWSSVTEVVASQTLKVISSFFINDLRSAGNHFKSLGSA